jgi:hypothetical protein
MHSDPTGGYLFEVIIHHHIQLSNGSLFYVGFEILATVVMKNAIFWDIRVCSPLEVNGNLKGTPNLLL